MESRNNCAEIFGKRLKELRKENGLTIEQFAEKVGISKSSVGYYENDKRLPDIEILSRIADVLNVSADFLLGRTNTTAQKGKLKTVCEFTGLSDSAVEYLSELVKSKDYEKLSVINHLFYQFKQDYEYYSYENENGKPDASSILAALYLYFAHISEKESVWDEFVDIENFVEKQQLKLAYGKYLIDLVTDSVKQEAENYRLENL